MKGWMSRVHLVEILAAEEKEGEIQMRKYEFVLLCRGYMGRVIELSMGVLSSYASIMEHDANES